MLLRAIDDLAHAFLNGDVLGVDALDTGEVAGLLTLAVDQVVIVDVGLQATIGKQLIGSTTIINLVFDREFQRHRDVGVG